MNFHGDNSTKASAISNVFDALFGKSSEDEEEDDAYKPYIPAVIAPRQKIKKAKKVTKKIVPEVCF